MIVRPRQNSHRAAWLVALSVAFVSVTTAYLAWGQINRAGILQGPSFAEYYDKDPKLTNQALRLRGVLTVRDAERLTNGIVFGHVMKLEHYSFEGATNLVARAPECFYEHESRTAWSTGQLEIVAMEGRFFITGRQGFEMNLTNNILNVSNRVRTVLRQNLFKPTTP